MSEMPGTGAAHMIGAALVQLTLDYAHALSRAGGDPAMVVLFLPDGWIKLAADTHKLLMAESMRAGMRVESFADDNEQLSPCPCGSPLLIAVYDPRAMGHTIRCARCGEVRLDVK
jgi:hypothetical protein